MYLTGENGEKLNPKSAKGRDNNDENRDNEIQNRKTIEEMSKANVVKRLTVNKAKLSV